MWQPAPDGSHRPAASDPQALEVLRAYIAAGSIAAAAHEMDIAESTARQHLFELYRRTGCANAAQAAYWLGRATPGVRRPVACPTGQRCPTRGY
jgi:DNA-binding NarL/FixJ family response regulator